jgi:hypothetical protein
MVSPISGIAAIRKHRPDGQASGSKLGTIDPPWRRSVYGAILGDVKNRAHVNAGFTGAFEKNAAVRELTAPNGGGRQIPCTR